MLAVTRYSCPLSRKLVSDPVAQRVAVGLDQVVLGAETVGSKGQVLAVLVFQDDEGNALSGHPRWRQRVDPFALFEAQVEQDGGVVAVPQ
jgi:hypothetical protein